MAVRSSNLVEPLAHKATDMRTEDTSHQRVIRSSAVSQLSDRLSDVDSSIFAPVAVSRPSPAAARVGASVAASCAAGPSADWIVSPPFSFADLFEAYFDCRRTKRNTASALAFEMHLERNLRELYDDLVAGTYVPGRSICFVITRPKAREVWAAAFRDRIVHHLMYIRVAPRFERTFIPDSCACIKGRGTLYGAKRLEGKIRSVTENWSRSAHYLKCDAANFFVSIDKRILLGLLLAKISEPFWRWLTELILMHDPRADFEYRGDPARLDLVPRHKLLTEQDSNHGLPIGNLSSQFFANVLLNEFDQFVKHVLGVRHYTRYVDDMIFLDESPARLNEILAEVTAFLPRHLGIGLNPSKTILQPVYRGVDFVGQVIKPWRRYTRPRTVNEAVHRVAQVDADDFLPVANSYFGLLDQAPASHRDRARIANAARRRGHAVNHELTKTYRGSNVK